MRPSLGDAESNAPGLCSYERPDSTTCNRPAAWHGIMLEPEPTGLESCDDGEHLAVMADIAQWIHPWTPACADNGFAPDANSCAESPDVAPTKKHHGAELC